MSEIHESDLLPTGPLRDDEVQFIRRVLHDYRLNLPQLRAVLGLAKDLNDRELKALVSLAQRSEKWGWFRRHLFKAFLGIIGTIGALAALRNDLASLLQGLGAFFSRGP